MRVVWGVFWTRKSCVVVVVDDGIVGVGKVDARDDGTGGGYDDDDGCTCPNGHQAGNKRAQLKHTHTRYSKGIVYIIISRLSFFLQYRVRLA